MAFDTNAHRPVFVLGMGRCGSTLQQVVITELTDIWIWGEHDGMIAPLLRWLRATKESKDLLRFSFATDRMDITKTMQANNSGIAVDVAWLNGFRPDDLDRAVRDLIRSIFETSLPPGKTRWGFKEIRYAAPDRTAEGLLELFPHAKILHATRHPYPTIESSLLTWHHSEIEDALERDDEQTIDALYLRYASRWASVTGYYVQLSKHHPSRVRSSKLEAFWDDLPETLEFLEASTSRSPKHLKERRINSLNTERPDLKEVLRQRRRLAAGIVAEHAISLGYSLDVN